MSCAKTVRRKLIGDSAGDVIGSAIKEIYELTRDMNASMDRFEVAHTAVITCTTPADLAAHYLEGGMHLKVAFDKLKKLHEFSKDLNVDAIFVLARQCESWRGLTDEQLKAGVERQVAEARTYVRNSIERLNTEERMKRMKAIALYRRRAMKAAASRAKNVATHGNQVVEARGSAASIAGNISSMGHWRNRPTPDRTRIHYPAVKRRTPTFRPNEAEDGK